MYYTKSVRGLSMLISFLGLSINQSKLKFLDVMSIFNLSMDYKYSLSKHRVELFWHIMFLVWNPLIAKLKMRVIKFSIYHKMLLPEELDMDLLCRWCPWDASHWPSQYKLEQEPVMVHLREVLERTHVLGHFPSLCSHLDLLEVAICRF